MYAKCGYLEYARRLFDEMPHRNIVSWTALISGYAQHGRADECFCVFSDMLIYCRPTEFAFASVLSSCGKHDGNRGRQVHAFALKTSFDVYVFVSNALISMYFKSCDCGGIGNVDGKDDAWTVFKTMEYRNLISWNSMIAGLQLCGLEAQAISVFSQMHCDGVGFDRATLLSVFSSLCGINCSDIDLGLKACFQLHCLTIKTGFHSETEVATALVKAYSNLGGEVADCYGIFLETNGCRDVVSWTGIITAFAEQAPEEALFLFCQFCQEGLTPDRYTLSIVLKACSGLATERCTWVVHVQIIKAGFEDDTVLKNALIHAYARCGSIILSKKVFNEILIHDIISWNSMLKAYALHGLATEALLLFSQMNVKPDATTFVSLLSACGHSGMVKEGTKVFDAMSTNYGIVPRIDHYACMVDILGRAGRIPEAEELVSRMPMKPDFVVWSALLGACRKHNETRLAKLAATKLNELEPTKSLGYVQMSNLYSSSGSFNEASLIRKEMSGSRVRKEPGLSWIEIGNKVHEFTSGGRNHPQRDIICAKLEGLVGQLKEKGYVPETSLALHDVEEEQKEEQMYHHSEKLALVFALMNEGGFDYTGGVIRIMKNIRICVDCHNFMKLASNLFQKEIIVRDSNRFHHFRDNMCSCNDYW
ncbi:pentatricopeptide repeat-containing protein At1g71420 isoform X2 [Malania oleifera]|nr:pentatricopeptide repeat-containing protein At1g71420 isoform X2 [Malania oleifera]XP_057972926.1 pentatricopeptide repeat-containing protein At1g71420 isoform X2 [Malania oleifera]